MFYLYILGSVHISSQSALMKTNTSQNLEVIDLRSLEQTIQDYGLPFLQGVHSLRLKPSVDENTLVVILSMCEQLTSLDLTECRFNSASFRNVCAILPHFQSITTLTLSYNGLDSDMIAILADALSNYQNLSLLNLNGNRLSVSGAFAFGRNLPMWRCLTRLHLFRTSLDSEGMILLSSALVHCESLSILDLGCNHICDKGAAAVAAIVGRLPALKVISLALNEITDIGVIALAPALVQCKSLQYLNLTLNNFAETGTIALGNVIPHVGVLKEFLCAGSVQSEHAERFRDDVRSTHCRGQVVALLFALVSRKNRENERCPLSKLPKDMLILLLQQWRGAAGHWDPQRLFSLRQFSLRQFCHTYPKNFLR